MSSHQQTSSVSVKDDLVSSQIKQSAVNVLTHYSELAAYAIHYGESTARTQIRMLRYLADAKEPPKPPTCSRSSPSKSSRKSGCSDS